MNASIELPGFESQSPAASPLEKRVAAAIVELRESGAGLSAVQEARAEVCLSLARSIAAGTAKGRAVANEAQQLAEILGALEPKEAASDSQLAPDAAAFLDALRSAAVPRRAAPDRHPG